MAAGDAEKKDKEKRRRPGLRIEVKGPGGFLVLGGAVILAGFGAAWAANRAPAKDRRKKSIDKKEASDKEERGQRNDGEEKTRSGIPSPLLLSSPEIVDLRHEKLTMEVKGMGIQENKFIYEIKQNPKICMVTEENHLEANIIGDGVKDFSLDGDESNMPEYSKEPIAEGLRSIDVQGAVEESEGGEEVEEKSPSVEYDKKDSSLDGNESSKPEFSKEPIAEGLRSVEVKGAVEESEGGEKIQEEALSVESDMKDFSLKGDESNIPAYSKKPVAEGSRSVDVKGTVEESECGEKIEEEAPSLEYDMKDSSLDGDESNMPEFSKEPIVERSRLVDVKGLEEESEGGEKTAAAAAVPSVEYDMKDSSLDDDESNMLEYSKEPIAEGLRSVDVRRTVEESKGGKEIEEEAPLVESNKEDFLLDSDKSNMPKFSKEPTAEGLRSVDVLGAVEENDSSEDIEERAPSVKSDTKDCSLDGDVSNMPYSKKPIAEGLRSIDVQGAVEESKGGEELEEALSAESDKKEFSLDGDELNMPEYLKEPIVEGTRSIEVQGAVEESKGGEEIEEEEAPLVQSDMKEFSLDGDECRMSAYSQEPIIEGFRSTDVNGAVEESEGGEKIETAAAPSVEYDMKDSSLDGDESNILEYSKEPIAEGFMSADVKRAVEESEGGKEIEEEALSVESDKKDFLLDSDESNMLKFSKEPTAEGLRSVDVQGAVEENDSSEDIEEQAPSVESDTKDFSLDGDVSNMPEYSKKLIAEGLRSVDVKGTVEESEGGEKIEEALLVEYDMKDSLDGDESNMPEFLKELIAERLRVVDVKGVVEENEAGEKIEAAKAPSVEYDIKDSSLHGDESSMLEYSKELIAEGSRSADLKRAIEESEGGKEIEEEAPLVESDKKDFLLDSDESNMPEFPKEPLAEGLRSVDIQGAVEENDGSEDIEEQAPSVESITKDFSLDGDVSNMPEYSKEPIAEGSRSIDVQGAVEESKGGEEFEEALSAESDKKNFQLDADELNMPEYLKEPIVEGSRSIDVQGAVEESKCGERKEDEEEEEAPLVQSDMKEVSLDGDECNMSAYSQEPIIEELRSIDVNGALEESQGGEEIEEEAPSVESEEEGIESSIKEDGSDGTAASSVESNTNVFWPAEMLEKEESLPPPESIKMKNNSEIHKEIKKIVDAAREAEIVEEYEEKGPILDEREAIAAGNMKTIRLTTTMIMGKEMDITSISHSKVFLLMLILALSIGLLSFTHHPHLSALYQQFCQLIFPVKNDTL